MLDLVSSNITTIVSLRPARVGRREIMVGVLILRFGLPVMLQLDGPSVLADWQALANSSIINPTFIGYEKHLVIGQFSFTVLLLFTGHPSMTPVSFDKTTESFESPSIGKPRMTPYPPSQQRIHMRFADESYEVCRLGHHLSSIFTRMDRNGRS